MQETERKFMVYKHTSPDGKIYIGMTSQPTLEERSGKNGKGYSQNQFFWEEIKKFGWDNFTHEILEENLTEDQACEMEREMIKFYQSNNPEFGYNIRQGGDKPYHFQKHTDGTRARISESLKGRPAWNSGKTGVYSDETRRKMGEKNIGKPSWNLGIPCADTTRHKIGESNKGRHHYNNGEVEITAFECPDGFTPGRLKRGKKWYNNGDTELQAFECPDGFTPGRLKTDKHYYNNGVTEIRAFECPDGFTPGRLYHPRRKQA